MTTRPNIVFTAEAPIDPLVQQLCGIDCEIGNMFIQHERLIRRATHQELPVRVIFNDPATIVFWEDGTKTVVKCQKGDEYDRLTGFLLCMMKKRYGNSGGFNEILNRFGLHPAKHDHTLTINTQSVSTAVTTQEA